MCFVSLSKRKPVGGKYGRFSGYLEGVCRNFGVLGIFDAVFSEKKVALRGDYEVFLGQLRRKSPQNPLLKTI